ncbi:MAG: uracil-DNA glycosylase [Anaerolineaceae bacterium]|nr:uracil-DNA glycosylase [Anaerolineaceae bacterium]
MLPIPASWQPALAEATRRPSYQHLQAFLARERQTQVVYPPAGEVFNALALTPFSSVRAVILGQDPYHGPGQAHGLAFSVRPGLPPPPSLRNIFRELHTDLGARIPNHGCLLPWAEQGVLLLNAVLTVRGGEPGSHQGQGWEAFTDAILMALSRRADPLVFVLWGNFARQKAPLVAGGRHLVLTGPHPSPLSAHRGFFGSRPFSRVNAFLRETGQPEIDWQIPDL